MPTVIGWLKPVVLLPASALAGLAPQQLEAILAHELAHIRRHDYLVNLLQTLVETLLFYHPAVWWLSRRIRIERENCCDDLAVSLCGDPVTLCGGAGRPRGAALRLPASSCWRQRRLALQRVRRLLGAPSHAGRAPGWLAGSASVLLVMVGIAAGALGPDAFARRSPTSRRRSPLDAPSRHAGKRRLRPRAPARESRAKPRTLARDASRPLPATRARQWPASLARAAHGIWPASPRRAVMRCRSVERRARRVRRVEHARAAAGQRRPTPPVAAGATGAAGRSRQRSRHRPPSNRRAVRAASAAQAAERASRRRHAEPPAPRIHPAHAEARRPEAAATSRWSNNGEKLEVRYRGDVEFTDDDARREAA